MTSYGTTRPTVSEYGCCKCQVWHRQGEQVYDAHLMHQSKHGIRRVPATDAERLQYINADLLAALEGLVQELNQLYNPASLRHCERRTLAVIKAREAIKRAKGEA